MTPNPAFERTRGKRSSVFGCRWLRAAQLQRSAYTEATGPFHQMPEALIDVFFYGLFIDEDILRSKGVTPRAPRKAVVPGYRLRIGKRARLSPAFGDQAFGMVFSLTDREIESLYVDADLDQYRPEAVIAFLEDGTFGAATIFNLHEPQATEEPNLEYAAKLRLVFERLGFPIDRFPQSAERP